MTSLGSESLPHPQDAGRGFAAASRPDDDAVRRHLVGRVASALRDMIILDELKPGTRIRERQLSERLNVSRTPLREAIRILVSERLVDSLPNRGAVVANPDMEEVRQLLEVLGTLEALGGRLAATAATDDQIQEILALHHEMLTAYYRKDKLAYFKLNQAIHKGIVGAGGNRVLVDTHLHHNARLYRIRYISNQRNDRWHEAVEQHELIAAALKARDAERLADLLRDHIGHTWSKVYSDPASPGFGIPNAG